MKGSGHVEYSNSESNCFATVSWPLSADTLADRSTGNVKVLVIQTENGKKHFLSVSSSAPPQFGRNRENFTNIIKINGKYGQTLQVKDGEHVLFWERNDVSASIHIQSAEVTCCSKDDWEILETNAEVVSTRLLSQLRVVYPGQTFPFWLSKSMVIFLRIEKISPNLEYGILSENSEIIIPSLSSAKYTVPKNSQLYQNLRIHPIVIPSKISLGPSELLLLSNKLHGFAYKSHFRIKLPEVEESVFVKIHPREEGDPSEIEIVKIYFLDSMENDKIQNLCPFSNIPSVFLHPDLVASANLESLSWTWISIQNDAASFSAFKGQPSKQVTCPVVERDSHFRGFEPVLEECCTFVMSSLALSNISSEICCPGFGSILIHGPSGSGKTSLANAIVHKFSLPPYFIHWETVCCAKLRGKKPENVEKELVKRLVILQSKQPSLLILDDIDVLIPAPISEQSQQEDFLQYKSSETLLETVMRLRNDRVSLICTARSPDKINTFWKSRTGFHFFQNCVKIPTTSKAERLDIFTACLKRYLSSSGSVGSSCCSEQIVSGKLSQSPHNNQPNRASCEGHKATVAQSCSAFHRNERGSGGATRNNGEHDNADQNELFHILGRNDELTEQIELALGSLHEKTATPRFLVTVAKKWGAYLKENADGSDAAGRGHVSSSGSGGGEDAASGTNNIKTNEDVNEQMKTFNEILQEEIRFSGDSNEMSKKEAISWESIGGLDNIKKELKKILEWPIKFPQIFKNAPIRLPCGILFYGYPGTGKSLMGLAIQTIVNVKFIHVKGPELLSKYIGASEQAVQDVFSRARESRPCILFFDEFDSLVPRRGHDSSGVSDRVVNQFLSEMDGVDGGLGEGVYLIASTSRPDLIDPAVLRPGRLDKHLFFDIPSQVERKEILTILSSQIGCDLSSDSDWSEIVALTEGYTGADLNALIFSARLSLLHEHLSKLDNDEAKLEGQIHSTAAVCTQEIQITRESLLSALKDFKPSVTGQEYRTFQSIYHEFSSATSTNGARKVFPVVAADNGTKNASNKQSGRIQAGKKATLA